MSFCQKKQSWRWCVDQSTRRVTGSTCCRSVEVSFMYCEQTYIICLSIYLSIYLSAVCIAIRTSDDNDGDDLLTSGFHDDSWCLKVSLFERIASRHRSYYRCVRVPQDYGSRLCTWRLDEFRADTKYVSGAKQLRHTGWAKNGATDSWPQFCQLLNRFMKVYHWKIPW